MKCNMGVVDRSIRGVMGLIFVSYAFYVLDPIWMIPTIIITYTVATRWCILYHFLGINTGCHIQDKNKEKGTQTNIVEGLAVSLAAFFMMLILYLIIKYLSI